MLFIFNDCDNCPVYAAGHGDKDCGNKAGEISPSPGTFVKKMQNQFEFEFKWYNIPYPRYFCTIQISLHLWL